MERRPRKYDWSGYRQLFDLLSSLGLRLQVVLAFHACGGNVGDNAEVPLPPWVMAAGERDPDIFFTDRPRELSPGRRNKECISLFAEEDPGLLKGRSAIQCYVDFMKSFREEFTLELGTLIEEVIIGCGPCGELRYPSYPEPNGWRFPGIGEFQCYDRRALASLARAASAVGRPEWGNAGPHDAGTYNTSPEEVAFFQGWTGRWDSSYGKFFLSWYSNALLEHGERMMAAAGSVFTIKKGAGEGTIDGIFDGEDATPSPSLQREGGEESGSPVIGVASLDNKSDRSPGIVSNGGTTASNNSLDSLSGQQHSIMQSNGGIAPMVMSPRPPRQDSPTSSAGQTATNNNISINIAHVPSSQQISVPGSNNTTSSLAGLPSRPSSYASFRSSSVSEGLNALEDWSWPSPSGPPVQIALKIAGVHWWYRTRSHPAELTAGYHNCEGGSGYGPIIDLCARHGAALTLTCVEMCDSQHPPEALCGPEGLLRQVRETAAAAGVPVAGENALPCFMPNAIDEVALQRVVYNTQPWGTPLQQGGSCEGLSVTGLGADIDRTAATGTETNGGKSARGSALGGVGMLVTQYSSSSSSEGMMLRGSGFDAMDGVSIGNGSSRRKDASVRVFVICFCVQIVSK